MEKRVLVRLGVAALCAVTVSSCTSPGPEAQNPELAPRGTAMTTVQPSRQDLANSITLDGVVTMNPVVGLVAPAAGQVRFLSRIAEPEPPTKAFRVGSVWKDGEPHWFEAPAGSTFAGRLVEDKDTVTAGMPVATVELVGYGIVADIDGSQAYRITDGLASVRAQIKNGPGPFPCTALGTIAALPAGTVPAPPAPPEPPAGEQPDPGAGPTTLPPPEQEQDPGATGSEPTGMRLVCTAPPKVKLINGAAVTLDVVTQQAKDALVVPVEAVAGGQGSGQVEVVEDDGSRRIVEVELGLTDGKVVQIRSGLTGTETITVPGPDLPPAPAQGEQK
ncbi:hypothetical protein BLA60_35405 [Actinophytocola xinjiangensis]|uniref:Multidrug efflux pump subunit AcrA (Membrane-fusion protein) n=1 Tax=Actinophytocola xinjiangensis TaxID=485602 RepID=A0A7Z0WEM6_9PSEU|nr:efflux RND transporter periplasmic adaptor subunit [Actinophytocola xinjiangensis]OLF05570.1 hypothetical protein BLA60_35405 [Actinophytocola xinjiangensis]